MKRKILLWIMLFAVLFTCLPVNSVMAKSINDSDVFLKQQTNYTCTLASAAMMLRRRAILDNENWTAITENSLRSVAWREGSGLYFNFTYNGIKVGHDYFSNIKQQLISMLNQHPEGIVIYNTSQPHAVLVTDYDSSSDTFYCGDPMKTPGRIKLSASILSGSGQSGKLAGCSAYWYITNRSGGGGNNPTGTIDSCTGGIGTIKIGGWAYDPDDKSAQLDIHVYVGGSAGSGNAEGAHVIKANKYRPDVNKAYGVGDYHGFEDTISVGKTGQQTVYIYAINVGSGDNVRLGSKTVNITNPNPVGAFDKCSANPGTVTVRGWAYDPNDTSSQIDVHVYVGGPAGSADAEGTAIRADKLRTDVNAAYGVGDYHGYEETIAVSKTGSQPVYIYGINIGNGNNELLGSKTVSIPPDTEPPQLANPQIVNLSSSGYTVKCTVKDNAKVEKVLVPSWTPKDGQDDIIWHKATISGNEASCRINISEHNNENEIYYSDIYVYDKAGNETSYKSFGAITIPKPPFTVTKTDSTFEVHNATSDTQSAAVIVADYSNGALSDVHTQTETFAPDETKTYSHGANAKVFVWDSLTGMKPLAW